MNEEKKLENTFKIINDNGEEVMCDILFTFDSEETKKSYIVYTDNSKDKDGNVQVFASIYDPKQEDQKLEPITTEQEWKVIETILNTLQEEIKKKTIPEFSKALSASSVSTIKSICGSVIKAPSKMCFALSTLTRP